MNYENDTKAYPCDEPENGSNASTGRNYPCDTDESAFFDASETNSAAAEADAEPVKKGKGRRGGNAAASVVIHSGNFRAQAEERPESRERRGYGERRDFDRDGGERGERRERRGYGEHRDFDRDSRGRRDFDGEKRGYRGDRDRDFRGGRDSGFRSSEDRGCRRGSDNSRFSSNRTDPEAESCFSRMYTTRILKTSEVGAFVKAPEEILNSTHYKNPSQDGSVLLPFSEQLGRPERGAEVKVYFYEDKGGRLTATMRSPILRDGEVGVLTVADVTKIGAFLDNGVPKQVLLPFKEQTHTPAVGDEVLVWIYSDKSGRQAATMRVYKHLDKNSPYKEDDRVTGFVYEINEDMGIFVAVDDKYYGLVPIRETFQKYAYGDEIEARVAKVREDGKLDLLIRDKLYKTVQEDADVILYELKRNNGFLPYGDRADAAFIEETYAMSKNQFKRALGHLYRNHIVELDRNADTVRLLEQK